MRNACTTVEERRFQRRVKTQKRCGLQPQCSFASLQPCIRSRIKLASDRQHSTSRPQIFLLPGRNPTRGTVMKNILRIATLACLPLLSVAAFGQTVKEVFAFNSSLPSSGGGMTPAPGPNGKLYRSTAGGPPTTFGGSIVTSFVGGRADATYTLRL